MIKPTIEIHRNRPCEFKCGVCGQVRHHARGWGKIRDGFRFTYYVCASCIEAGPGPIRAQWREIAKCLRGEGSDRWADHFKSLANSLGDSDEWRWEGADATLRVIRSGSSMGSASVHHVARVPLDGRRGYASPA